MEGPCKPVRGEKQGCEGGRGSTEGMMKGRGWEGRWAERQHGERCWPARPPEREFRPQKAAHPILKLFPEIYRPEWKSWYVSNSF